MIYPSIPTLSKILTKSYNQLIKYSRERLSPFFVWVMFKPGKPRNDKIRNSSKKFSEVRKGQGKLEKLANLQALVSYGLT